MQTYRKLRSLLLLASSIRKKLLQDDVHVAQAELQDGSFPPEFVKIIEGVEPVPSVETLQTMRPKPHGVFDCLLLVVWCRNRLTEAFMEEESGFCLAIDLVPEE